MRPRTTKTVLLIAGMHNNMCREQIAQALERVHGVCQVEVSFYRAHAVVLHEQRCAPVDLVRAVTAAGYGADLPQANR